MIMRLETRLERAAKAVRWARWITYDMRRSAWRFLQVAFKACTECNERKTEEACSRCDQ